MSIINILAAGINPSDLGIPKISADSIFVNVLNLVYFAAGITAVIVIIIAGYMFVSSSGEPANTRKAKDMILYGVIGLTVVMVAFIITQFVIGRF